MAMAQQSFGYAESQLPALARHIAALEEEIKNLKKPKYESGYLRSKFG